MTTYWCEHAWLGERGVVRRCPRRGRGRAHQPRSTGVPTARRGAIRLAGLTIPGFANCHSHAFHRALRAARSARAGRSGPGATRCMPSPTRLDPDSYYALARATYEEMAAGRDHGSRRVPLPAPRSGRHARTTTERHGARAGGGGTRRRAADRAARRLLPVVRLRSRPRGRADPLLRRDGRRVGRTGSPTWSTIPTPRLPASWSARRSTRYAPSRATTSTVAAAAPGGPLHVHVSEQVAENDGCLAAYGLTPTQLLAEHGAVERTIVRGARHPPHGDDDRHASGSARSLRLLLPDDRARPRRRDRADALALVEAGRAAHARARTATRSSTRSRRCVRSSSTPARDAAARTPGGRRPARGAGRSTGTARSASTTPVGSQPASGPTW